MAQTLKIYKGNPTSSCLTGPDKPPDSLINRGTNLRYQDMEVWGLRTSNLQEFSAPARAGDIPGCP